MSYTYRLPPGHLRRLRRIQALVDANDGSMTPEELTEAQAYLATHASCEAYLQAQITGAAAPSERPHCAQGFRKRAKVVAPSRTKVKVCPVCKKQKSVLRFDDESGKCIKCEYKQAGGERAKAGAGQSQKAAPTRTRKCPVCLQRVTVHLIAGDWTVQAHTKETRSGVVDCSGGGTVLYHERRDAMDHIVPGNFEGGKRR